MKSAQDRVDANELNSALQITGFRWLHNEVSNIDQTRAFDARDDGQRVGTDDL